MSNNQFTQQPNSPQRQQQPQYQQQFQQPQYQQQYQQPYQQQYQQPYQQPYQQQYQQPYQFNKPPKKGIPTIVKVLIGIGIFFVLCFIVGAILGGGNTNNTSNVAAEQTEATQKWKDKAIKDSTHIANGYYAASAMSDIETFIKKYHELELMAIQQPQSVIIDSTVIIMGNKNANNAMAMLTDSATVYRNKYTKLLKDKLWLDNITVRTENGGKTLWLIGGIFASNRNISDFQNRSESMFKALGYKRICYKWIDVSSAEYTYFDLD